MKTTNENSPVWRLLSVFSSLRLTVIGLMFLLVLTVWGTLYQVEHGLFQSQQRFFRSWFFLAGGFLPFPGGQLVMGVMLANLLAACTRLALQGRMQIGLLLTHAGLILMLGAGAVTFYLGVESHLTLFDGEASNVSSSPGQWELAVFRPGGDSSSHVVTAIDAAALKPGTTLAFPTGDFEISVVDYFPHAEASKTPQQISKMNYRNGSGIAELTPRPQNKEPGDDRPGLMFAIRKGGADEDHVLLWGGDTENTVVDLDGKSYVFELRRIRYPLPATIQLVEFKKEMHPGSDMARSFSSKVIVKPEQGAERTVTISMNKPLRFQGFTFYQSSYNVTPEGRQASTFAVVKNFGRTMPYIATFATFLGMVIHFVGRLLHRINHLRYKEAAP